MFYWNVESGSIPPAIISPLSPRFTKGKTLFPLQVRLIHLALMGSIWLFLSILLPTLIFYIIEPDWTFLDGLYFVFISLTTIGLGDYIPGDHPDMVQYQTFYKTCVGLFLLFGLVLTSLTLTVFYDIPQLNLGLHLHRHR